MRRAIEAARSGDNETAIENLSNELDHNPTNGYAHMLVAVLCSKLDSYGAMLQYAQSALKYLPKNEHGARADMYGNLYDLYITAKDTVQAMKYLQAAQKEVADNESVNRILVNISLEQGKQDEAMQHAKFFIKRMPKSEQAYLSMAKVLKAAGEEDEAIRYCDQALGKTDEKSDERCRVLYTRAKYHQEAGHAEQALSDLMAAVRIELWGSADPILRALVDTIPAQVLDSITAAKQAEPNQINWDLMLYDYYYDHHEYIEAARTGLALLPKYEYGGFVRAVAATLENMVGAPEKAEALLTEQLRKDSTSAGTYISLADLYASCERYAEAFAMSDKALSFDTDDDDKRGLYLVRGRMHQIRHEYEEAVDYFRMCLIANPDDDMMWFRIGKVYGLMNDSVKQAEAYEQGKQRFAAKGKELTAEAYVALGDTAAAYEAALKMVKKANSAEQQYNKACVLAQIGHADEAIEALRLAFENGFRHFNHIAWDTDLDAIRYMPAYTELVNEFKQRNEQEKKEL